MCEVHFYRSACVSVSAYLPTFPGTWFNKFNLKTKQDCAVIDCMSLRHIRLDIPAYKFANTKFCRSCRLHDRLV